MISAGELNKKVTMQTKSIIHDIAYGGDIPEWVALTTVWANVQLGNGREFFAAQRLNPELSGIIKIRYRKDITAATRIVYAGRNFDLLKPPINVGEKNELLELHVKEVV